MFFLGLDLGKRHDHTAIAIVEKRRLPWTGSGPDHLLVRHLERVPLGTPYTGVVTRVRDIVRRLKAHGGSVMVVVDATGVGTPVVEELRRAGMQCEIVAVTITGGEKHSVVPGGYSVPKRDLITAVQMALEKGELKIARKLEESGALVKELLSMRVIPGRALGSVRIGAEGYGEHDDLAIALALGCWRARRW